VDYGSDFVGRYAIRDLILAGVALTPSFAYQVTDKLSLGAGVSVLYTALEQSIAIRRGAPDPALDGRLKFEDLDDWGVQGVLGLTYAFNDRLLLGLVYRIEADVDLRGDVESQNLPLLGPRLPSRVEISWTNPQWLEAGLRYTLDDKTLLFFNLGWQEWSKFSENVLSFNSGTDQIQTLDRSWDDTWHAGIVVARALSPRSYLSLGLAYESSPVKDKYRTLDFPVDEMWKLSAAYGWRHSDALSFACGATLSFFGDAPLEQTAQRVTVRGDFDSNMAPVQPRLSPSFAFSRTSWTVSPSSFVSASVRKRSGVWSRKVRSMALSDPAALVGRTSRKVGVNRFGLI
jgi:long-chain fatty acid transport protein